MRDRVAHEWKNKPEKLHYRICHKAEELFEPQFKKGRAAFQKDETVLFLCASETELLPFREAEQFLGRGMSVLIVDLDGSKFIAETETEKEHPYETFAGS